jgi:hypothetical protein
LANLAKSTRGSGFHRGSYSSNLHVSSVIGRHERAPAAFANGMDRLPSPRG